MADEYRVSNADLIAVADAIREKTETSAKLVFPDGFVSAVESIDSGGASVSVTEKDVNFYDYDGTCLYAYTVEEAQALNELPALPECPGLICQGWNWSLEDIKAHNRAVNVGAMYTTDDGTTRIYITLQEGRTSPMLGCCPNGTVMVDWGDGTTPDVLTGTSTSTIVWTNNHEYAESGDYVITLTVQGELAVSGANEKSCILCQSSIDDRNQVYLSSVNKVELGDSVTKIGSSAFEECHSLASIIIPDNVKEIGNFAFYDCYSLTSVIIPDSVTKIGSYVFQNCYSLASVIIPDSVKEIGDSAFRDCHSLASIIIPDNVTKIGNSVFRGCKGVRYYDFSNHTAVPTLDHTNALSGIASDCEIRVPSALYNEWIAATNWATYADKIVAV